MDRMSDRMAEGLRGGVICLFPATSSRPAASGAATLAVDALRSCGSRVEVAMDWSRDREEGCLRGGVSKATEASPRLAGTAEGGGNRGREGEEGGASVTAMLMVDALRNFGFRVEVAMDLIRDRMVECLRVGVSTLTQAASPRPAASWVAMLAVDALRYCRFRVEVEMDWIRDRMVECLSGDTISLALSPRSAPAAPVLAALPRPAPAGTGPGEDIPASSVSSS
mmetsp:Transcript_45478/g.92984  ORF Transcript_45478/g.92984 Transcript_45478/m.92984 type:complete len:224 (-) Transcript_45478:77-748(-)